MSTVYSTTDYSMFSLIKENRTVGDISLLESDIKRKNMLSVFPIIVNKNYQVLDGQHRLAVARKLGLEIFYILDDGVALTDIPLAAKCVKRWNMNDYLQYYAESGNKNYKALQDLLKDYPFVTAALVLHIVPRAGFGMREKWFQSGAFSSVGLVHVHKTLSECARYKNVVYRGGYKTRIFICTMSRLVKMEWFDGSRLFQKLLHSPSLFVPCVTVKQCVEMLERAYNYRAQNRISFFDVEQAKD